jgi:hypothetical protein
MYKENNKIERFDALNFFMNIEAFIYTAYFPLPIGTVLSHSHKS